MPPSWSLLLALSLSCGGPAWTQPACADAVPVEPDEPGGEHGSSEWTYERQDLWPALFADCGGKGQSPTRLDAALLQFGTPPQLGAAPGLAAGRVHATNTGHTLQLQLATDEAGGGCGDVGADTCSARGGSVPVLTLSGANSPLAGTYHLEQLHFHWGDPEGAPGSEHRLNGQLADAEAHFVFFDSRYGSISEAVKHSDGLAVLAVLLKASEAEDLKPEQMSWPPLGLQGLLSLLSAPGSRITVPTDLRPLLPLLEHALTQVFSYSGSLTTPPCSPVVRWLVSGRLVAIQPAFLRELSSSLCSAGPGCRLLQSNRRCLQMRHNRLVVAHVGLG